MEKIKIDIHAKNLEGALGISEMRAKFLTDKMFEQMTVQGTFVRGLNDILEHCVDQQEVIFCTTIHAWGITKGYRKVVDAVYDKESVKFWLILLGVSILIHLLVLWVSFSQLNLTVFDIIMRLFSNIILILPWIMLFRWMNKK